MRKRIRIVKRDLQVNKKMVATVELKSESQLLLKMLTTGDDVA